MNTANCHKPVKAASALRQLPLFGCKRHTTILTGSSLHFNIVVRMKIVLQQEVIAFSMLTMVQQFSCEIAVPSAVQFHK